MKSEVINKEIYNDLFLIILGAMFISISAQMPLSLPLLPTEIPGTWQTFVILVFAFLTNRKIGILAVAVYLFAGALGLPVFAESSSGVAVLFGKTSGYLFGFLVGAGIVGHLGEQENWKGNFGKILFTMFLGTAVIVLIGTLVLGFFIGFENGITDGLTPFLLGAAIKILLGAIFVKVI